MDDTIESMLSRAATRGDRRILLDSAAAKQSLLLELQSNDNLGAGADTKPASSSLVAKRITQMGFIAVALQPLGGHALRRGLAADMKDLGHEWTTGTGHRASLALGHNHMSERKGLTDYCADNTIAGLLNARAANLPMPKKQTSADMLQDLDSMTKRTAFTTQPLAPQDERDRAWLHMRARDDLKARDPTLNTGKLRTRAEEVALRMIKEAHASGLPPRMYLERSANSGLPSPNPPQLEGDEEPAAVDDMVEEDDSGLSVSVAEGELDAFLGSYNIGSGVSISNVIDKTVQDVDRLCDHVLEHGTQGTDWSSIHIELAQDDDECVAEPLEGVPHDALLMQAPQLIAFFTSYNIIRKPGKGAASIDLTHYRRLGKDEPKFMVFKCPKGCGVESQSLYYIEKLHECKRTKIVRPYVPRKVLEQPDKSGAMLLPQSLTGSNATPQQSFGLLNPPSVGAFTSGVLGAYQSPGSAYSPMPQVLSVPEQVHRSADAMGPTHTGPIKRPVMTGDSLGVTATGVDSGPPRKRGQLPRLDRCLMPGCTNKPFRDQREIRIHLRTRKHGLSDEESSAKAREVWESAESPGWLEVP